MGSINDESIEISKFGAGLIAFACGLAVVLIILARGRAMTNTGSDMVQKQMSVIEQYEFTDYDQQTLLGTQVRAAYENFSGKGIAVLICNRAFIESDNPNGINIAELEDEKLLKKLYKNRDLSEPMQQESSDGSYKDLWCINYNAVFDEVELYTENGYFYSTGPFAVDDNIGGNIKYNNKTSNMKKQGMAEYVPTGARYQANLIKNSTDQVVGVVFIQLAKN